MARTLALGCLAFLLLALAAGPAAGQEGAVTVDPAAEARTTMKRLVAETRGLPRSAAGRGARQGLVELAVSARRAAARNPCGSTKLVAEFRRGLGKVSDSAKRAKRPGPASPQGELRTAAFAADAALKQLPRARRCGGGAAPAGETFSAEATASDRRGALLSIVMPRARWTPVAGRGKDFTELEMTGAESIGQAGDPGVPAFTELLAIPEGANVTATVTNVESYTLRGIRPFPKQQEAVDGFGENLPPDFPPAKVFADPPFAFDPKAFAAKAPVPGELGEANRLGTMRDLGVAAVQIAGARFSPKDKKLQVITRIDLRIDFGGASSGAWRIRQRTSVFERAFTRIYDATLVNYRTVATDTGESAEPAEGDQDAQEDAMVLPCGEDMLIVTSPALRPAAETLAEARRSAGLVVAVRETGDGEGQIGTQNTQIRDFIRGALNDTGCTRPTYVVLVGDVGHVPTFFELPCTNNCPANAEPVATDLPYSLDGIGVDPFADVLLGRLPAIDLPTAQTMVDKIVGYETTAPAPPGDDFYNEATVTAAFEGLGPVDGRTFSIAAETVRSGLRSRGHVVERLYSAQAAADIQRFKDGSPMPEEIRRPVEQWAAGRDQIVDAFNDGRFFFMHRDHGSRLGWANPGINVNDMPRLANGTQLPVVFGINCSSAAFQFAGSPSLAQRMLQHPGGGAVGYFGDTEVSPTNENTRLAIGFADALFPATNPSAGPAEPLATMGEVLLAGKAAMGQGAPVASQLEGNVYKEHLIWHYLGDPSMQMWAATPTPFENVQTAFQPRTGAFGFDEPAFGVRVTIGQPGTNGAIATLRNDGEAIGRAIVEDGEAVIQPDRRTDSSGLTVALEGDGFLAREVPVNAPAPTHTIQCPPTISSEFGVIARGQVLNNGTPIKDGLVTLRFTTPTRTFTRSVLTDAEGRWIRQEPVGADERGPWKIEAFFHDKGVKDAVCEFVVP